MTESIVFIEDAAALAEAVDEMAKHDVIGVDTESDSMYAYFEKVCFIQIKAGSTIYLVDTIALRELEPLIELFADPDYLKVLHGADYDVVCLQRDFGVEFHNLFDTMIAAQFLGKEQLGLAALCLNYFGVELDKSLTRHDWSLRPVEDRFIDYLADDVRFLAELEENLRKEVRAADIHEEYTLECERVRSMKWKEKKFEPESYRKIKGSQDLDIEQKCVLKSLNLTRDRIGRELDLPAFRIMNSSVMLALARRQPRSQRDLAREKGIPRKIQKKYGQDLIDAIRAGLSGEVELETKRNKRRSHERSGCEDALRKWRQAESAKRECPPVVVLPNHVMAELIEGRPETRDELKGFRYLGSNRIRRYGDRLLEILADNA